MTAGDEFGASVAISDDTVIVGAPAPRFYEASGPGAGSAYAFFWTWCATDATATTATEGRRCFAGRQETTMDLEELVKEVTHNNVDG